MPWIKEWPAVRALYAQQLLRMLRLERAAIRAGMNVRPRITNEAIHPQSVAFTPDSRGTSSE